MNLPLPNTETETKTLLHIEDKPVNSRLLRKIMQQRQDIAMLTARYDDDAVTFIRKHQPEYLIVNLDALGNNINQIYHALVMLNEIHRGKLIVSGYDTSSLRILTGWMSRLAFIDFPLNSQALLVLFDTPRHTRAA